MRKDKEKAIELRKQGKSYNEINKILQIPKSTLSLWLKSLDTSEVIKNDNLTRAKEIWRQNIIKYNKARAFKAQCNAKTIRLTAANEIKELNKDDLKLIGVALYWAEGYNRAKWSALFCNSDPRMVKLIMRFFREICEVPENLFRPQVQIHSNISSQEAETYWSQISNLNKSQFGKPLMQLSKSSQRKRPPRILPYGTFRIGIANVNVLHKIKGWIEGLARNA
ncbi:hypothetical protein HZA42_01030, partial [Candidatus Peregrinibacteria bacterium]|nr:hypothetical protein [Candidatus Peregrinibacteria bacterium]